jgi:hypothetical protein
VKNRIFCSTEISDEEAKSPLRSGLFVQAIGSPLVEVLYEICLFLVGRSGLSALATLSRAISLLCLLTRLLAAGWLALFISLTRIWLIRLIHRILLHLPAKLLVRLPTQDWSPRPAR